MHECVYMNRVHARNRRREYDDTLLIHIHTEVCVSTFMHEYVYEFMHEYVYEYVYMNRLYARNTAKRV